MCEPAPRTPLTLAERLATHSRTRAARNAGPDELALYAELLALAEPLPPLTQQLMDASPTLEALNADGWMVKLSLRPEPLLNQPQLYTATLWKPRMGRGVRMSGDSVTEALDAVQLAALDSLTRLAEQWGKR